MSIKTSWKTCMASWSLNSRKMRNENHVLFWCSVLALHELNENTPSSLTSRCVGWSMAKSGSQFKANAALQSVFIWRRGQEKWTGKNTIKQYPPAKPYLHWDLSLNAHQERWRQPEAPAHVMYRCTDNNGLEINMGTNDIFITRWHHWRSAFFSLKALSTFASWTPCFLARVLNLSSR